MFKPYPKGCCTVEYKPTILYIMYCAITQRNCHKMSMLLNVYVPKHIITKHPCHTTKAVIKHQTSRKVNITKRQMFQNITSQNENRHKTTKNV